MYIKPRPDLLPLDAIVVVPGITIEHIELLVRTWWLRKTDSLQGALPPELMLPVAQVFAFGAAKYSERGWENDAKYHRASASVCSFYRHYCAETLCDYESGLPHQYHAACRYVMLSTLHKRGLLIDDRPPLAPSREDIVLPEGSYVVPGGVS